MRLEDAREMLGRRVLVLLQRGAAEPISVAWQEEPVHWTPGHSVWIAGVLLDANEWGEATVRTVECIRYCWPWLEVIEGYGTAQETICE
jgi:hypothetical protein